MAWLTLTRAPDSGGSPQRRVHGRAAQIGLVEPGADGPGATEVSAAQHGLAQVGLHQAGLPQPAAAQVDAAKVVAAEHRKREVHLVERHWPHPALHKDRAQHAALRKGGVPQQRSLKRAIAKRRSAVLRLGQVGAAEVAFAEHGPLGARPTEVFVAKIPADNLAIGPLIQSGQLPTGNVTRACSAYSLIAISASVADLRSLASIVITGMCRGSVSASRTSATG
jgi:hypothetical protein